jgi:aryl-phospho-beta-D-glucosidase BglC (GH1 family)
MFGFRKTNSPERINQMFCELVGPDFTAGFWKRFKEHYITREDIAFIASAGANTIRLPFHYKLFTDEDYMGLTARQDGFARIDSIVNWCRDCHLYLILDMHNAPSGQTGDNIDDSYGYPWLFESETSQQLFCDIWKDIAAHYRNETVILGYDLINEPVAPYFDSTEALNDKLVPLYKRVIQAIRQVDTSHIILLGGAQWNGNFKPLQNVSFDDDKIMYTCHRYGGEPAAEAIREFIHFRDSVNRPVYMGETGHNTDEWQEAFCRTMEENNIGYTFWPYKKTGRSSFVGINPPEGWQTVIDFSEAPRSTYKEIREARPDQETARKAMNDFIEACKFRNCIPQEGYIKSLRLHIK